MLKIMLKQCLKNIVKTGKHSPSIILTSVIYPSVHPEKTDPLIAFSARSRHTKRRHYCTELSVHLSPLVSICVLWAADALCHFRSSKAEEPKLTSLHSQMAQTFKNIRFSVYFALSAGGHAEFTQMSGWGASGLYCCCSARLVLPAVPTVLAVPTVFDVPTLHIGPAVGSGGCSWGSSDGWRAYAAAEGQPKTLAGHSPAAAQCSSPRVP